MAAGRQPPPSAQLDALVTDAQVDAMIEQDTPSLLLFGFSDFAVTPITRDDLEVTTCKV